MIVAYVLREFPKISESFIINEICELIDQGIDVKIFALQKPEEEISHEKVKRFRLMERTTYLKTKFSRSEKTKALLKNPALAFYSTLQKYDSLGKKMDVYLASLELKKLSKENKIQLFHCPFASYNAELAVLASDNIPITTTCHAYDIFKQDRSFIKKILRKMDKIITISQFNKNYMMDTFGIEEKDIKVIHVGIPVDEFKRSSSKKSSNLVSTGRLVKKKGTEYLIRCLPRVLEKNKKVKLHIIGDGPLMLELKSLAKYLKVDKNILFHKNLDDKKYLSILRSAGIFILPCIKTKDNDIDGIPVVLMEAMAMGIPVISTRISGIPELAEGCGILVPEKDKDALADAINNTLTDDKARNKLADNAKKKVLQEFNLQTQAKELADVWKFVL